MNGMLPLKSKILLFPYWMALKTRHFLYDKGICKSTGYPIPVICVGNITVGGTGKTPHTEMIIRMVQDKYRIAVLSRGYKRK
ncbi:MAG: tetraacyldisaccharide 4'-kinase, partial [Bacteroidales bacterium]|nr:tetraacyldisaccharide 4'-kinase [Bacteroidales bacterium]